jgi:small basic protein
MWLPVLGLMMGFLIGSLFTFQIPPIYAKYMSVAILAAFDSVFGGVNAVLEDKFDSKILLTGFFTNMLLAAALAYFGDRLGVDLYMAAVFAFGVRLFQNLGKIRFHLITRSRKESSPFRKHSEQ